MPTLKTLLTPILGLLFILTALFSCGDTKTVSKAITKPTDPSGADGFISIFDGRSLDGWEGDTAYWRVEDGNLTGEVTPATLLKKNTFIIWKGGQPADFELQLEFRITEAGNSGINYRSERLDSVPFALRGYQADIDGEIRYTGQNYEERKRTTLAYRGEKVRVASQPNPQSPTSLQANIKNNAWQTREILASLGHSDSLKANIKKEDWNHCRLTITGNRLQHYINGILMSDVTDMDSINQKSNGFLGLQVHVGPPMKVAYRNIRLKQL